MSTASTVADSETSSVLESNFNSMAVCLTDPMWMSDHSAGPVRMMYFATEPERLPLLRRQAEKLLM